MTRLPLLLRLLTCYEAEPSPFRRMRLALIILRLEERLCLKD